MTKTVHKKKNISLSALEKPTFSHLPTKQQLLINTAWDLFNTYGYKKTTVTDICEKAGSSKVTFYKYFGSKLGVLKDIIESIIEISEHYFNSVIKLNLTPAEKFSYVVAMKEKMAHWLSSVFYMDMINLEDEAGKYFLELQNSRFGLMREFFVHEQESGALNKSMNVDFMVHIIQKLSETMNDEVIKSIYGDDLPRLSRDVTRFIFFGISGDD